MSSCCYIFINHLKYRILNSLRNCKKFYWPSSILQEAPHKRRIPITSAFSTAVMCYTVYTYVHGATVATTAECLQNGFYATFAVSIALCTQCMKTLRVLMHHRCNTSRRLVARCTQRVKTSLHDTTGCQTRCQTGCTTRFDNRLYRVNGVLGIAHVNNYIKSIESD